MPHERSLIRTPEELAEVYGRWVAQGATHEEALLGVLRMAFADGVTATPNRFLARVEVYSLIGGKRVRTYDATAIAPHSREFRVAGADLFVLRAELDQ